MLDTDICIYLIRKKPASVIEKLNSLANEVIGLSVISIFELQFGVEKSQHPKQYQTAVNHFLEPIQQIPVVDRQVAERAAMIRADLQKKETPIGSYDMLIAATALTQNVILVSNNTKEFERVEGLMLENWAK